MEKSKTKITGIANTEKYSQVQLYPEKVGELCSPAEVNIMENLENEKEFLTPSNLSKFVHCSHIFTQYRDGLKKNMFEQPNFQSEQNKLFFYFALEYFTFLVFFIFEAQKKVTFYSIDIHSFVPEACNNQVLLSVEIS